MKKVMIKKIKKKKSDEESGSESDKEEEEESDDESGGKVKFNIYQDNITVTKKKNLKENQLVMVIK